MKTARPWPLIAAVLIAAALAYLARDPVHDLIVLPIAYVLWQIRGLSAGVSQLVQWAILVTGMALVMAWQLVPRFAARSHTVSDGLVRGGQVNATAVCLWRARSSNYFRWQLAHRLGRAASQLGEVPGDGLEPGSLSASIAQYLDAGLNHSFVDYSAPRFPFASPAAGPLGLAPEEVLRYLETHLMEVGHPDANSP